MTPPENRESKTRNPWPWVIVVLLALFLGFTFWPGFDNSVPYSSTVNVDSPGRDLGYQPEAPTAVTVPEKR